ncbi:MAG: hypothetical protein OXQ94_03905 [Gemmatimonadota bacterium]|nr:hypothetical protein [Gemmatimonadota bacterium]MDE2870819.1 hypothetical protein [Gemmatimonadota bacterium]
MDRNTLNQAEKRFGGWQQRIVFEKKYHKKTKGPDLRKIKGGIRERQKELRKAVSEGPDSLGAYLRNQLGLAKSHPLNAPTLDRQLTPQEFVNPPVELEMELGAAWRQKITPRDAAMPHFWLLCHINWIEQGKLGDSGNLLNEALLSGPRRGNALESETRNFLRRTGGIFVRGNTSVLSDCTLSRAWWRHRLATDVARVTEEEMPQTPAHEVLHRSGPGWETLVMLSLKRITAISQPAARAAIIVYLARHPNLKFDKIAVKNAASALARLGLRRALDYPSCVSGTDAHRVQTLVFGKNGGLNSGSRL